MKLLPKLAVLNLFCLSTLPVMADDTMNQYNSQQTSQNTQNLVKYLLNLGGFLGYDITQSPTANNKTVSQQLLNAASMQVMQTYMVNTFLGAIPVNAFSAALASFVPSTLPIGNAINPWANNTFNTQKFSDDKAQQQGSVSVNSLIDQQNFQPDPINQGVLNILGTPSSSYCMDNDGKVWTQNCPLLYDNLVSANAIGPIPSTYQYFTYNYNQQFLSQLNSNSLLGPLLYSTQSTTSGGTSSGGGNQKNQGLTAQNQAQQAANFIRYVSGGVLPAKLPKLKDYDTLYGQAVPAQGSNVSQTQQKIAQGVLSSYLAGLRTYAAQTSVGLSNLYFIMSKRLPQDQSGSGQAQTSQAVSEFNMATWRLFKPDLSTNNQWINQINNASPATVQKEIATLLAEMNYQMYLDRQIQERILLTNSVMLIQNTVAAQPNPDVSAAAATAAGNSAQ